MLYMWTFFIYTAYIILFHLFAGDFLHLCMSFTIAACDQPQGLPAGVVKDPAVFHPSGSCLTARNKLTLTSLLLFSLLLSAAFLSFHASFHLSSSPVISSNPWRRSSGYCQCQLHPPQGEGEFPSFPFPFLSSHLSPLLSHLLFSLSPDRSVLSSPWQIASLSAIPSLLIFFILPIVSHSCLSLPVTLHPAGRFHISNQREHCSPMLYIFSHFLPLYTFMVYTFFRHTLLSFVLELYSCVSLNCVLGLSQMNAPSASPRSPTALWSFRVWWWQYLYQENRTYLEYKMVSSCLCTCLHNFSANFSGLFPSLHHQSFLV